MLHRRWVGRRCAGAESEKYTYRRASRVDLLHEIVPHGLYNKLPMSYGTNRRHAHLPLGDLGGVSNRTPALQIHVVSSWSSAMERPLSPTSLALDRQERMYELFGMVRSGEIRLEQAFMKLGLGFAPAVNEDAIAFATTSPEAFTDLFNACVDEQATQLDRTPKQRSASQELNSSGAARITVFSGAEPDDIHHENFRNAPNDQKTSEPSPRRPSSNKVAPQANPQLEELAVETLSIKPSKVRRERRLSVDAERLIDPLIAEDSGHSSAATVKEDQLSDAAVATRRKERRRSVDGSIMAGVRRHAQYCRQASAPPPAPRRPRASPTRACTHALFARVPAQLLPSEDAPEPTDPSGQLDGPTDQLEVASRPRSSAQLFRCARDAVTFS